MKSTAPRLQGEERGSESMPLLPLLLRGLGGELN